MNRIYFEIQKVTELSKYGSELSSWYNFSIFDDYDACHGGGCKTFKELSEMFSGFDPQKIIDYITKNYISWKISINLTGMITIMGDLYEVNDNFEIRKAKV